MLRRSDNKGQQAKHKFTEEEDRRLHVLVEKYGTSNWRQIAAEMNGRTNRQCRERWKYYLAFPTNQDMWSPEEDELLIAKVQEYGKKWSKIASFFVSRTDINLKNRYKKIIRTMAKKPCSDTSGSESTPEPSSAISPRIFIDLPVPISALLTVSHPILSFH